MAKTELSKTEIVEIISNYNLGELQEVRPLTGGTVQTNLLLETTGGRFVLRLYEGRSPGSVGFEANLIRYLKARDYPCPAIFRDKHGRLTGLYQGKPCALFEFVEGYHIERPTAAQQEQLIEQVAELHNLTRNYRPALTKYRWNYSPALCRELARKTAARLNTPDGWAKVKWLETTLAGLQLPWSLPMGVCHADFHFSNVLFKDGRFAALLDFDDANYTYLLFDVVGLLEREAWRYDFDEVLNFEVARSVVALYVKYRPLNALEKRHLFDVYRFSILIDCVWYFSRGGAVDFYEKRKIDFLNGFGRENFYQELFKPLI
jgi:homoserine kinase type II